MAQQRVTWIDAARGLCVIAIVLMHFLIWMYRPNTGDTLDVTFWNELSGLFGAFRLPLLFAVSGLLVAGRIRNGWSDIRNANRVISSYYLYVVWLIIYGLLSIPVHDGPLQIHSLASFGAQLLVPQTILWFVLALAIYVALLTTVHRAHPAIVLAGLAMLSVSTAVWADAGIGELANRIVYYAFFFAIGVYVPRAMKWFAAGGIWWKFLTAAIVLMGLRKSTPLLPREDLVRAAMDVVQDTAAVFLGVSGVALLCTVPLLARLLAAVGRRTFQIYVLQMPALWLMLAVPGLGALFDSPIARALAPAIGTAAIILFSVAVERSVMRTPVKFLFIAPPHLQRRSAQVH